MGRGRRVDRGQPGRDSMRPATSVRQPSANSTVSASRGADGRIEIAAEPAPSVQHYSAPSDAQVPRSQIKVPAAKPTPLPVHSSPTSPLPATVDSDAAPAVSASTTFEAQLAGEPLSVPPQQNGIQIDLSGPSQPPAADMASAAVLAPQPGVPPVDAATSSRESLPAPATPHPGNAEAPLASNASQPSPAPQSPSAPHQLQAPSIVPSLLSANGSSGEAGALQLPPHAAPLQQALPLKPKALPGPATPGSLLSNGHAGQQMHQQPGPQGNLPALNGRSRPFMPHQPHMMQQQQQPQLHQPQLQQQLAQQLPRRQLDKPSQAPYSLAPDLRQLHSPGMSTHMLSNQAPVSEQGQGPAGQARLMHQPQPGTSRSSSIGQKRPMPNPDMPHHRVPPHQLASPQQQRGPHTPSGPPMMPFNGQMMPFMSSPNGMPNASLPGPRNPNSMPFLMQNSPRPSLMNGVPLMNPLNMAMGKSAPVHQHNAPPFGANPYMQMQHMSNSSAPHAQTPHTNHQVQAGPQFHPQMQSTGMQSPTFNPQQRPMSSSSSLPNGPMRSSAGLSPAASLGNSAKGSSSLRATAVPFIPGGMAPPASPLVTAHSGPAGPSQGPSQAQPAPHRSPRQLQAGAGMASAAPFYPSAEVAGESGENTVSVHLVCTSKLAATMNVSVMCNALSLQLNWPSIVAFLFTFLASVILLSQLQSAC